MSESLDRDALARVIYETEQRIQCGHVKVPWDKRVYGAAKQHCLKTAELILFDYAVNPCTGRHEVSKTIELTVLVEAESVYEAVHKTESGGDMEVVRVTSAREVEGSGS